MTHDRPITLEETSRSDGAAWQRIWARVRIEVLPGTFAIAFAMTLTLCIRGYQFGGSNHNVYLIDALHQASGGRLLANDWFTTGTLQYHAVFGVLTRNLFRMGIVEPAFLVGQLILIFLMHLGWFRLVRRLGGTRMTYLLSVLLFYLMAGGVSLGVYEFLQDQAFLPSNIANVAMLWGIYFWLSRKPGWAGVWLGVAGLFHLNHAIVAIGLWGALNAWKMWDAFWSAGAPANRPGERPAASQAPTLRQRLAATIHSDNTRGFWIGSLMVLGISIGNIAVALSAVWAQQKGMSLQEVVDLYVNLRHPHHYAPRTWPLALWIFFLLPIPLAVWACWWRLGGAAKRSETESAPADASERYAWLQAARVFALITLLLVTSLLAAGFWFHSETLIKLSLYRFTIYMKLLACIGTAYMIYNAGIWNRRHVRIALIGLPVAMAVILLALLLSWRSGIAAIEWVSAFLWRHRGTAGLAVVLCGVLAVYELIYALPWRRWRHDLLHAAGIVAMAVVIYFAWGRWLGVQVLPDDEPPYLALCEWAKRNTPVDAVFLVPPDEQSFRLHAERAIVVNFKGVPQLNGELVEWKRRLQDVLAMTDLTNLRRPTLDDVLDAIRERYAALPAEHLIQMAHRYGARFVISVRPLESTGAARVVHAVQSDNGESYFVYDLQP